MASRKITDLSKPLQVKAAQIELLCANRGLNLLIYCTYRDPYEQARCYRKSRTLAQIIQKSNSLIDRGYPELARILIAVGPQMGKLGKHFTWSGPGESWHQYCRAFDAVPMAQGKCLWSYEKNEEEWQIYGDAIETAELHWGGRFGDFPHAQVNQKSNALDVLPPADVRKLTSIKGVTCDA